jgi:PKD repeat protein/photosystem II stability/assembly factor-like uncharacterized protein
MKKILLLTIVLALIKINIANDEHIDQGQKVMPTTTAKKTISDRNTQKNIVAHVTSEYIKVDIKKESTPFVNAIAQSSNSSSNPHKTIGYPEYPVWLDMMEREESNLAEAKKSFDAYWSKCEHFRGDRSKQFEKWYEENIGKLDVKGNVISRRRINEIYQNYNLMLGGEKEGDWYIYGPVNVAPRNGIKQDGGRVKDIEYHPQDPKTIFASCYTSGFFKSTDDGENWTPLTDHLIDQVHQSEINPQNPDIIYIATDLGVKKTLDGGKTWTSILNNAYSESIILKQNDPNTIVVGSEDGIRLSDNGGQTFQLVQAGFRVDDLKKHPTKPDIMYAGTNDGKFYKSINGGKTWMLNTSFPSGEYLRVAVTPAQPDYVYVIQSLDEPNGNSFGGVYFSSDAGNTFVKRSGNGVEKCITCYEAGTFSRGQPNYNLFIVVDPKNPNLVFAGGVQSWRSTDGGVTWSHFYENITTDGASLHLDQLNWSHHPKTGELYACNDGGVYKLLNDGKFKMITDGLPVAEVWEISQSKTDYNMVIGGTFHCGFKLNDAGQWLTPGGGDNAFVLIDYQNPNYMYYAQYDRILRSTDRGRSFSTRLDSNDGERGLFTSTGFLDNVDPNSLYLARKQVARISNVRAAHQFKTISNFAGTDNIQKVEQCSANGEIAYVSRGNALFRTDNLRSESVVFTPLTLPVVGVVNDIATSKKDANLVYIMLGTKVYKSVNKGQTWTDYDPGLSLPSITLLEMVADDSSNEGIYVGSDFGVFYKDATMSSWVDFSKNLPAIPIKGMDIFYGKTREESILTVATDGRGIWRTPLHGVKTQKPEADFKADRKVTNIFRAVKFTSLVKNNPFEYQWSFPGGTPSKSLDLSPTVKYDQPGTYAVTLKVKNSAGVDTETKAGFIKVIEAGTGSLQVHYPFESDLSDVSSYLRDGATIGSQKYQFGQPQLGKGYQLDGSNMVSIPGYKGVLGANDRTISMWVKTTVAGPLVSYGGSGNGNRFTFRIDVSNALRVEIAGNVLIGTKKITDDQWHHVALTLKEDSTPNLQDVLLYVDGQKDAISSITSSININTTSGADVTIGSFPFGSPLIGSIDDFRMYNTALTESEIVSLMKISTSIKDQVIDGITSQVRGDQIFIYSQNNQKVNAYIYTIDGKEIQKLIISDVENSSRRLPNGAYLLSIEQGEKKIVVKHVVVGN